jgi:hypothetical protein
MPAPAPPFPWGPLLYLYTGTSDAARDAAFWVARGARKLWHVREGEAEVVALEVGQGPRLLLANHRAPGAMLPIWGVDDVRKTRKALDAAGWRGETFELPTGTCHMLRDSGGLEVAVLEETRRGLMEKMGSA